MSSIDQRVVDMQFNNRQFEDGIKTSLDSLNSLTKGLDGIDSAGIAESVDTIAERFTTLGIIGVTALQNITDRVVDLGIEMVKSISVDQVSAGFTKYEQKVGAVQTIMNATGKDIDSVSNSLEKLNWFTDETSYDFVDMVSNIGKFTSAGVDLDKSVTAMQGIANLAALSGQNVEAAGRAMYNFSQAIGVGAMKLQDWKSIENANMATMEFKQVLIDTGLEIGTLAKDSEGLIYTLTSNAKGESGGNVSVTDFTSSLSQQWMTTDVMMAALQKYGEYADAIYTITTEQGISAAEAMDSFSGETMDLGKRAFRAAQEAKTFTDALNAVKDAVSTGWMTSFEHIFGNYVEAKELWTDVANEMYDLFASGGEARNEMLATWKEMGGRDIFLESMSNLYRGFRSLIDPIREAFENIFPPMTAERLYAITEALKTFTEKLTLSEDATDKLRRIFEGLFSAIGLVLDVFGFLFNTLTGIAAIFAPVGEGALEFLAAIGDWVKGLKEAADAGDVFSVASERVIQFVSDIVDWLKEASGIGFDFLKKVADTLVEDFNAAKVMLEDFFGEWELATVIEGIAERIGTAIDKISEYFGQFSGIDLGPLRVFTDEVEVQFRPFTFIAGLVTGGIKEIVKIFEWAAPFFQKIADVLGPIFSKIWDLIKKGLEALGIDSFRDVFDPTMIAIIVTSLVGLFDKLKDLVGDAGGIAESIKGVLEGVGGALEGLQQKLKSQALLNIAIAVGVLAAAILVLSKIDGASMAVALAGITAIMIELTAVMIAMSKFMGDVKLGGISAQMVAIAAAIFILAQACSTLAEIDPEGLGRALISIMLLLAELVAFEKLLGDGSGIAKIGLAMIPFATGILIMAQALKSLADLYWEELLVGLAGLGGMLVEVGIFSKIVDSKGLMTVGLAMIPLATGLLILSQAIKSIAGLNWEELLVALTGLGGMLAGISIFSKTIDSKGLMTIGLAMIPLATGLLILSQAIKSIAGLNWEELVKGFAGIFLSLKTIVTASKSVSPANILALGVAMVGVGAGLMIIAGAMLMISTMSWESIIKGLTSIVGVLAVINAAAKRINPVSMAKMGLSLVGIGVGLALLTPSLVLLGMMDLENIGKALLTLVGVFAIFGSAALVLAPVAPIMIVLSAAIALLGVGTALLGAGLLALSAAMLTFAAAGVAGVSAFTYIVEALIMLIPNLILKIGEGLLQLLGVIIDAIPLLLKGVSKLLGGICDTILENLPKIIEIIMALLDAAFNILIEYTPKVFEFIGIFLDGVLGILVEYVPKIVETFLSILLSILELMAEYIQPVVEAALALITGFLKGIAAGLPGVIEATIDIVSAFLITLGEQLPRVVDAGMKMIIAFINGIADAIRENTPLVVEAMLNLASAILEGIVGGLFAGIKGVKDAIVEVAKAIWNGFKSFFGIHSPSTLMEGGAGNIIAGLIKGLTGGITNLVNKAKEIGGKIYDGISGAVKNIGGVASNVVDTLGNGLKNGLSTVGTAAKNIGNSILGGIKDVLGINSPAKTMIDAAHDTGEGLIVGMKDMLSPVTNAAENVGDGVIDAMKDSLSTISDVLDSDMDMAPTIRPVVDMSNVEAGLNNTFSREQSLNVGEIKSRTASLAGLRQNGGASSDDTGTTHNDNSENKVQITNHFHVRNDSDIQKINMGLDKIISKFNRAKGVPVKNG